MYVKVGSKDYTRLSSLTFTPETDITGSSVPVNEFVVDIRTDDDIALGSRVSLYDDLDTLWAKYWVTFAERVDAYTVQVKGQSALLMLDRDNVDPVMYVREPIADVLASVLQPLGNEYVLDQSFASETVSGYFPKQTPRVRLQWICMTIGAYLKNYFNDRLEILPIDDETETMIPLEKTYWKPKVTYKDHVTAVKVTYYDYAETTPHTTDKWVEVNERYYVETATEITLTNNDVPDGALENVITVEGVTAINQSNVSRVLTHLAKYYFKRTELDLDVIDNAEYMPGQKAIAHADADNLLAGYISTCSFRFGVQAKASMHLMAMESRSSATLVVTYKWGDTVVGMRTYRLPVGYSYELDNQYVEMNLANHRYTFRPINKKATGTIASGRNTSVQPVEVALDLYDGDLHVVSVDSVILTDSVAVIS